MKTATSPGHWHFSSVLVLHLELRAGSRLLRRPPSINTLAALYGPATSWLVDNLWNETANPALTRRQRSAGRTGNCESTMPRTNDNSYVNRVASKGPWGAACHHRHHMSHEHEDAQAWHRRGAQHEERPGPRGEGGGGGKGPWRTRVTPPSRCR